MFTPKAKGIAQSAGLCGK